VSTAARKARKRAGEPLVRVGKVGTPVEDRAIVGRSGAKGGGLSRREVRAREVRLKLQAKWRADEGGDAA
jgi:hypothetical protein